jgi:hypothetical protein
LRLTDEKIAAIRKRIARRKRTTRERGENDLAEINGTEDSDSYVAEIDEAKTHSARVYLLA